MKSSKLWGVMTALLVLSVMYACTKEYYFMSEQIDLEAILPGKNTECANGGTKLITWVDDNRDGERQDSEITDMAVTCNGINGIDGVSPPMLLFNRESVDGGTILSLGYDIDKNMKLSEDEVVARILIPDGKDGVDGQDGQDGQDGADGKPLVIDADHLSYIESCGGSGSVIRYGYETDGVAGLSDQEVAGEITLCDGKNGADGADGADGANGSDGADGADGADGQNGADAPVNYFVYSINREPESCSAGGVEVVVYDDVDANGELDPTEDFYLQTFTFCYGITLGEAIAIGDALNDYVDLDIVFTEGTATCPDGSIGDSVVVNLDGEVLMRLKKCPPPN